MYKEYYELFFLYKTNVMKSKLHYLKSISYALLFVLFIMPSDSPAQTDDPETAFNDLQLRLIKKGRKFFTAYQNAYKEKNGKNKLKEETQNTEKVRLAAKAKEAAASEVADRAGTFVHS